MYPRNIVYRHEIPDFSHLHKFHLIRPYDCTNLVGGIFRPQVQQWPNLRELSLESKKLSIDANFRYRGDWRSVQAVFSQLERLTISGMFSTILRDIIAPYCGQHLRYLYLHDIEVWMGE